MMPNLNLDLEYIDHLAFGSGPVKLMNTWAKLSERAGRNDMPAILAEARSTGSLMPSEVAKGLADAWTMAEWLARIFDKDIWRVIFGMALSDDDFLTDDGVVLPHTELPEVLTLSGAAPFLITQKVCPGRATRKKRSGSLTVWIMTSSLVTCTKSLLVAKSFSLSSTIEVKANTSSTSICCSKMTFKRSRKVEVSSETNSNYML
jgi:hypothetical protein